MVHIDRSSVNLVRLSSIVCLGFMPKNQWPLRQKDYPEALLTKVCFFWNTNRSWHFCREIIKTHQVHAFKDICVTLLDDRTFLWKRHSMERWINPVLSLLEKRNSWRFEKWRHAVFSCDRLIDGFFCQSAPSNVEVRCESQCVSNFFPVEIMLESVEDPHGQYYSGLDMNVARFSSHI